MQDCLANGKPLLIENIEEELDPILDPVLEKRFIRQARGLTLQLNDKEVSNQTRYYLFHAFHVQVGLFTSALNLHMRFRSILGRSHKAVTSVCCFTKWCKHRERSDEEQLQ